APPSRGGVSGVGVPEDAEAVASAVSGPLGSDVDVVTVGANFLLSADVGSAVLLDAVKAAYPRALIAGFGADMAVLKGVGHPRALTDAWNLTKAQGWQGVGHTRMATES